MSIFSDLQANRRAKNLRAAQALPFVVRSVNKDGQLSKMRPEASAYFATREEAVAEVARLVKLNPGRAYAVTTIAFGRIVSVAL